MTDFLITPEREGSDWFLVWCDYCGVLLDGGTYSEARDAANDLRTGRTPHDCGPFITEEEAKAYRETREEAEWDARGVA